MNDNDSDEASGDQPDPRKRKIPPRRGSLGQECLPWGCIGTVLGSIISGVFLILSLILKAPDNSTPLFLFFIQPFLVSQGIDIVPATQTAVAEDSTFTITPVDSSIYTPTPPPNIVVVTATPETEATVITATPLPSTPLKEANETACLEAETPSVSGLALQAVEILYDFEQDESQWNTSEESYKVAETMLTDEISRCGKKSLKILTDLDATSNIDIYHHTEATAYFDRAVPLSFDSPGPHSFSGRTVSCFVYIPPDFPNDDGDIAVLRIAVKDAKYRNQESNVTEINDRNIGMWLQLSLLVDGQNASEGFDAETVNTLGIWIITPSHSSLKGRVSIYIDDCTLS